MEQGKQLSDPFSLVDLGFDLDPFVCYKMGFFSARAFPHQLSTDSKCDEMGAISFSGVYMSYVMRKPALLYANNKSADQLVHPCSLISVFVIRCPESIIHLVSISKISSL